MNEDDLVQSVGAVSSAPPPSEPASAAEDAEVVGAGETDEVLVGVPWGERAVTALVKRGLEREVAAVNAGRPVAPVGVLVAEPLGLRTLDFISTYVQVSRAESTYLSRTCITPFATSTFGTRIAASLINIVSPSCMG